MFNLYAAWLEDEEDFLEPLESLKQASSRLELHESASCSCLLPCGLLPEELAELEGAALGAGLKVEAAVGSTAAHEDEDAEVAAPLTPQSETEAATALKRLLLSDEEGDEEAHEDGEDAGPATDTAAAVAAAAATAAPA